MDDSLIGLIIFVVIVVASAIKSIVEKLGQQPRTAKPGKGYQAPADEVRRFLEEVLGQPAPAKPPKPKRRRRRKKVEAPPEPAARPQLLTGTYLHERQIAPFVSPPRATVAELERKLPAQPVWRAIVFAELLGRPVSLQNQDRFAW